MRRVALLAIIPLAGCVRASAPAVPPAVEERVFAAGPIAPRTTFCNPLDLDYRFTADTPSRRDIADPVIALLGDEYYLFASSSGGYWRSPDLRDWQLVVPDGLPADDATPAVVVVEGRMYYTARASRAVYTTDDPAAGKWRKAADLASYSAPAFFLDDDGRVYLYHASSRDSAIAVVELDPHDDFKVVGAPRELLRASSAAPSMTKHDGTYYLQYASAGGSAVYTSRSPTGAFTGAHIGHLASRGFGGAGDGGSTFRDRKGGYWRVATMPVGMPGRIERRLGIVPLGFDSAGVMRANGWLGDYPQLLPGLAADPLDRNGSGWMLLSSGKVATASSSLADRPPALAFDGDASTWWSAATGGVGEWVSVDLGRIERVNALQVNFAEEGARASGRVEDSYHQYVIESSIDGAHWTTRLDESRGTRDTPHRYVQLDTARNARFVRVTNVHAAAGGTFALRELRVFGESTAPRPAEVRDVTVQRDAEGSATIGWTPSPGATAYIVRVGGAPDKLYASHDAGDASAFTVRGLDPASTYWFAVDAIGEGGVTRGRDVKKG